MASRTEHARDSRAPRRREFDLAEVALGLAITAAITIVLTLVVEWGMNAWWASEGLTGDTPPLTQGGQWLVGLAGGALAGALFDQWYRRNNR